MLGALEAVSLGGADDAAFGGDLAYRYGLSALGTVGAGTALATLADPLFAAAPQALRTLDELAREPVKLGS